MAEKCLDLGEIFGRQRAVLVNDTATLLVDADGGTELERLPPEQLVAIIRRLVERFPPEDRREPWP